MLKRLRQRFLGRRSNQACLQTITQTFQLKNIVRAKHLDYNFQVVDVEEGQALLQDKDGNVVLASWFTNTGEVNQKVAANWELVSAAQV